MDKQSKVKLLQAAREIGVLEIVRVPAVKTLRQACLERGVDPDKAIGYKTPRPTVNWVDRIIPGVADRESPSMWWSRMRPWYRSGNGRKMYTRQSAANDAAIIAQAAREGEQTKAYVAAFCRLNNLREAS